MPADNSRRNQLSSILTAILSGGGRGDPYQNEKSGPFATSPRIAAGASPASAAPRPAAAAAPVKNAPVPAQNPRRAAGGGGKKKAATGPNNMPLARNATSPSSLMESPEMNATSPSSLVQSPGPQLWDQPPPYPGAMPATGNTVPSPQAISRPVSPTPPTAALNMASGAGNGMGGNQFNVPSPTDFSPNLPATGNTVPSTMTPPHSMTPPYFNKKPRLAMPPPYGGPMAAADQSPRRQSILDAILAGMGGGM